MNQQSRESARRGPAEAAQQRDPCVVFTDEWVSALATSGHGFARSAALSEMLYPLAVRMLSIAREVPFQPRRAAEIGAALVAANFVDVDALGRSLTVIARHTARAWNGPESAGTSAIQEAVAAGYIQALRERTLADAQTIFRAQLSHQVRHDPLTGLANRALFLDRLTAAVDNPASPGQRIGICLLDLDGFKPINDSLGHDVGDELLAAVAHRLEAQLTGPTTTVARVAGDEFVLLVPDSGGRDATVTLASEILARIEQPFSLRGHRVCITASIGIVDRPAAGARATDLVKDADRALDWARAEGPGHWAVYDPARDADDNARLALTASLRSALDAGQFTVVYQPIVSLPGGGLCGLEALLRWNHPTLGQLSPEAFITLAEESGVITPLGRWVMATASRQAAEWRQISAGKAVFISVNLSPLQAQDPGFVGDVARTLAETGLPPELLQLELTESALVEADSRPLETLQKLSAMGVRIVADDFGSGYSNLAYLRRLPVDALKLSASFIREVWPDGPADEPIIAALTGLAHTLGLNVTVEGVETSEQASRLAALGCDTAQGWYFAPALSGDQVTALLRESPAPRFPQARGTDQIG